MAHGRVGEHSVTNIGAFFETETMQCRASMNGKRILKYKCNKTKILTNINDAVVNMTISRGNESHEFAGVEVNELKMKSMLFPPLNV